MDRHFVSRDCRVQGPWGYLDKEEDMWLKEMEAKKDSLFNKSYYTTQKNVKKMMSKLHARVGTPSRTSNLTAAQEKERCKLTWQNFDHRCWQAAFRTHDDLKDWAAYVAGWRKQARDTWLVFQ